MKNRAKYVASEAAILEYLEYDGANLRWKKKPPYSRAKVGDIAGGPRHAGLMWFVLKRHQLCSHIVIWWLVTGSWPIHEVDHRNVSSADNSFGNLRESTRTQNSYNRKGFSKSGIGLKGAYTHSSFNGRWMSAIVANGKTIYLGRFGSEEEAHAAYVAAAKIHHGEFARTE